MTRLALLLVTLATVSALARPATSGAFVLHKFARAIGKETYSIKPRKDHYTLTSDFLFTDRGNAVPLKTSFTAKTRDMLPESYTAKGRVSRQSEIDDTIAVTGNQVAVTHNRGGQNKQESFTPSSPWFVVDGYSPVAMQEQMMRWWLSHSTPAEFTVYPAAAKVRISPAEKLTVNGRTAPRDIQGYTVSGLIWGQETLWMSDAPDLIALVSTDAEFDHFEAVREPYAPQLGAFIAAAVKANLRELSRLSAAARIPAPAQLAITGATLEDSTGAPPVHDAVILIEDGLITAAGPRASVAIPAGAVVLDATGKFAIPGLWDMHAHYEQVEWGPIYLAAGVTSVRDCGNEFDFIRIIREELDRKQNPAVGPHLEFAGIIDGTGKITIGAVIADTPEQAESWVRKYQQAGAKQIKIYSSVKPEIVKAITAAAHRLGMTVTGHVPNGMTALDAINDGMDQINHIGYVLPYFAPDAAKDKSRDFLQALREHHTVLDPTAVLGELFVHAKSLSDLEPGDKASAADRHRANIIETLRLLHTAGVPMVAGTDQAIPAYSLHRELEIYVEAGFTPLEALQSATLLAAQAVGVENESGTLQPGKRGDVLLLDADPLADIHNTRKLWRTIASGAVYTPDPLWETVDFKP